MYFRKIRPRTTCLYSAASMLLRKASAARQSVASNPRFADETSLRLDLGTCSPGRSGTTGSPERWADTTRGAGRAARAEGAGSTAAEGVAVRGAAERGAGRRALARA